MDSMADIIVKNSAALLAKTAIKLSKNGNTVFNQIWTCDAIATSNLTKINFENKLKQELSQSSKYILLKDKYEIPYLQPPIEMNIKLENKSKTINAGIWNPKVRMHSFNYCLIIRQFYCSNTVLKLPYAYK